MSAARIHARGFTVIELMVVLAILAIVAAISAPSFTPIIARQRIKSAASSIQATLNLARAEALKRNANVTMAPVMGTDWASGWKVFDPLTPAVTLAVTEAIGGITVTGPVAVIYQRSGRTTAALDATFKVASPSVTDIRCVQVSPSGQALISTSGC